VVRKEHKAQSAQEHKVLKVHQVVHQVHKEQLAYKDLMVSMDHKVLQVLVGKALQVRKALQAQEHKVLLVHKVHQAVLRVLKAQLAAVVVLLMKFKQPMSHQEQII
jgi:hypothetical protein